MARASSVPLPGLAYVVMTRRTGMRSSFRVAVTATASSGARPGPQSRHTRVRAEPAAWPWGVGAFRPYRHRWGGTLRAGRTQGEGRWCWRMSNGHSPSPRGAHPRPPRDDTQGGPVCARLAWSARAPAAWRLQASHAANEHEDVPAVRFPYQGAGGMIRS